MMRLFPILAGLLLHTAIVQAEESRAPTHELTRDEAAKIAHKRYHGRLLDIRRRKGEDDTFHFRVKMLEKGRVIIFRIDARTGEVED